jgi:ribose 5-phosphate isomerase B
MSAMSAKKMTVYIGSDHAGFDLKDHLIKYLSGGGYKVEDMGCKSRESVDYPDVAGEVCGQVLGDKGSLGILICSTGTGMAMVANKKKGIRAALCTHELLAKMARLHNDANVVCLGSWIIGTALAAHIVDTFLETKFSADERHERRIAKMMCGDDGGKACECC